MHTACQLTLPPPQRQHAQYANDQAQRKYAQYDESRGGFPKGAEKEEQLGALLIIQCKGKEREKHGGLDQPKDEAQDFLHGRVPDDGSPILTIDSASTAQAWGVEALLAGTLSTASRRALPGLK